MPEVQILWLNKQARHWNFSNYSVSLWIDNALFAYLYSIH
jgi:hypothetical protein